MIRAVHRMPLLRHQHDLEIGNSPPPRTAHILVGKTVYHWCGNLQWGKSRVLTGLRPATQSELAVTAGNHEDRNGVPHSPSSCVRPSWSLLYVR